MPTTPVTHGLESLTFGVPATLTGYVVQAVSTSLKSNVVAEVFNESGVRVHARYDDDTTEMTFDAILQGATVPSPGAVFTFQSVKYETLSIDTKWSNKDFTAVSIKGKRSEGITLA